MGGGKSSSPAHSLSNLSADCLHTALGGRTLGKHRSPVLGQYFTERTPIGGRAKRWSWIFEGSAARDSSPLLVALSSSFQNFYYLLIRAPPPLLPPGKVGGEVLGVRCLGLNLSSLFPSDESPRVGGVRAICRSEIFRPPWVATMGAQRPPWNTGVVLEIAASGGRGPPREHEV